MTHAIPELIDIGLAFEDEIADAKHASKPRGKKSKVFLKLLKTL